MEATKVGRLWYRVIGPNIDAEIMKHNHTDYQAGQPSVKRNRVTITGKGAKRDRDKIITALLETFPDDFPGGITH